MSRRLASLALVLLAACTPAGPGAPGGVLVDGRVPVNEGTIDGEPWLLTVARAGEDVCLDVNLGGDVPPSLGCAPAAGLDDGSSSSSGTWSDEQATIVYGFLPQQRQVVSVVVETNRGEIPVPAVPLLALGVRAVAYGLVLPAATEPRAMRYLDGQGRVVERILAN